MNGTIDVKDLCVGSYVQNPNGAQLRLKEVGPVALVCEEFWGNSDLSNTFYLDACYSIEDLRPIAITPERLVKLGGHNLTASKGKETYGFCPEADGPKPPDMIHVQRFEKGTWVFIYDGFVISVLKGVHHLQALVWNLERVWLTLDQKEVSHE